MELKRDPSFRLFVKLVDRAQKGRLEAIERRTLIDIVHWNPVYMAALQGTAGGMILYQYVRELCSL